MSKRGSRIPKKLRNDAILEAIFEIRFRTTTQLEFLIVRLADFEHWKGFLQARLPAYSIPENVRQADPNFTYQPTFELAEPANRRAVRIGPNVLSYHVRQPYGGWIEFKRELQTTIQKLFDSAERLTVSRLGLRYSNALSPELHGILSVADLDLSLKIADAAVTSKVNINLVTSDFACGEALVRIASREFVSPQLPNDAAVLVDIDVFTRPEFEATTREPVLEWLEQAHTQEKLEFFCLLTDQTISQLEVN